MKQHDIASRKDYSHIVALLKSFANPKAKSDTGDAATNEAKTIELETTVADSKLKSNINLIFQNFEANTTTFANAKDKSFKENQIINITLDDMIKPEG